MAVSGVLTRRQDEGRTTIRKDRTMKDAWTKAAAAFSECLAGLRTRTQKEGVSEERFGEVIESEAFLDKCSDLITSLSRYLTLITKSIAVSVESFTKDSFFSNGPVKFRFWPNFKSWIIPAIPATIPAFTTSLSSFTLTKNMYDKDILAELGNPTPFTVSEFAAIIKDLLTKQPTGNPGDLLRNGRANIFYVKLEDERTVTVCVFWSVACREWRCYADGMDDSDWRDGGRVFFPA